MNLDSFSSQFSFSNVVTRKVVHSTFERSLIFKFEMLAILKFDCSKFYPSPDSLICCRASKNKTRVILFIGGKTILGGELDP